MLNVLNTVFGSSSVRLPFPRSASDMRDRQQCRAREYEARIAKLREHEKGRLVTTTVGQLSNEGNEENNVANQQQSVHTS